MITPGIYPPLPRAGEEAGRVPSRVELKKHKYMVSQKRHIRQWGLWEKEVDGQEEDKTTRRTRAGRALRNRKYRRAVDETRQAKRLFTPEIKKFLKGWLVRRRKNPYPNRSEKKELALKTGLTYMQICNWFANWRRKLKKCCREREAEVATETWGPLITGYNRQARGNVEQFSISSDDSIWDEANYNHQGSHLQTFAHVRTQEEKPPAVASSAVPLIAWAPEHPTTTNHGGETPVLIKWLESAARFRPRESCWGPPAVSWSCPAPRKPSRVKHRASVRGRHREELDAAEALTFLSSQTAVRHGQCV